MQLMTLDPHDLDAIEDAAALAAVAVRLAHPIPQAVPGARVAVDCCPSRVLAAWPAAVIIEDERTGTRFTLTRAEWIALAEPLDLDADQ